MTARKIVLTAAGMLAAMFVPAAYAVGPTGLATQAPIRPQMIVPQQATLAPYAFVKFCLQNKADCQETHDASEITLSRDGMRQLRKLNFDVNREITPQNDPDGDDEWQADVTAGDCEDFALTKRRHLIEQGWSPNALRLAIAYTPSDSGHAVLVVSTDKGDLVLDNRTNAVLDWRDTDLRWMMIQSDKNPLYWNLM